MTKDLSVDRATVASASPETSPLRGALLAHIDHHKMIRPLGSKSAVTPKIGEGSSFS